MKKVILCYVPVPHEGFRQFFDRYRDADIFLVSKEFILSFDADLSEKMNRNFNALPVLDVQCMLKGCLPSQRVEIIGSLKELKEFDEVIVPEGDIAKLLEPLLMEMDISIRKDTQFLMWDWSTVMAKKSVLIETETTNCPLHQQIMLRAMEEAKKSSDWWRRVGAVLCTQHGTEFYAHNEHMPTEHSPYINGDPRSNLNAGEMPDMATSLHAEVSVITQAASTTGGAKGADLYVTTFPCHVCARPIAKAGIKTVYFKEGYSSLDAKDILDKYNVKLVKVLFD